MQEPTTEFLNQYNNLNELKKLDVETLADIIGEMADDMRDLIQANRRYALKKYGSDELVEEYYCVKKLRSRLDKLGYIVQDRGGL